MIFQKYNIKYKCYLTCELHVVYKITNKFLKKPMRNLSENVGRFLIKNNQSLCENKIKYKNEIINNNNLMIMINLNKKIII